jgi:hypothetical protein
MRYYIPFIFLVSCGGIMIEPPTDSTTSALTCSTNTCRGSVTNGTASLPSENTYFCHPIAMSGSGAHSQSPLMKWGVPAWGAQHAVSASSSAPSMTAIPNAAGPLPHAGQASIEVQCDKWTNFTPGAGNGYSQSWLKNWNWQGTTVPEWVSGSETLWDTNSVCYLDSLGSTYITEKSFLTIPNGWNWQLTVEGYKAVSGGARCAWLGEVPAWNSAVWLSASTGAPANSGMSPALGFCLVYRVHGNLDDGGWRLNPTSGSWILEVSGGVDHAQAYCLPY